LEKRNLQLQLSFQAVTLSSKDAYSFSLFTLHSPGICIKIRAVSTHIEHITNLPLNSQVGIYILEHVLLKKKSLLFELKKIEL